MLKVGIIGATGYTGEALLHLLSRHDSVKITVLQAIVQREEPISKIFPALEGRIDCICKKPNLKEASKLAELLFLALPHRISMTVAPLLLKKGKNIIDLSADYRLNATEYEKWYGIKHKDKANIKAAVYGLPEFFRDDIRKANLIANPGCYPTAALLAIAPLAEKKLIRQDTVVIDAKSGTTGGGKKAAVAFSFSEVNENMRAYKVNEHQHKPEIDRVLKTLTRRATDVVFVPHLIPLNRGILVTSYMDLKKTLGIEDALAIYKSFYENEPFTRVLEDGEMPLLRDVQNTNFCRIGLKVTGKKVIAISAIDNLLKGAAGQAVQNMNIMYGFDEEKGLL